MPRGAGVLHAWHPRRLLCDCQDGAQPWAVPELQSERLGPRRQGQAAGTSAEHFPIHRSPGQVRTLSVCLLLDMQAACSRAKLLEPMQTASLHIKHHVKSGKVLTTDTNAQLRLYYHLRHASIGAHATQLDEFWLASTEHLQPAITRLQSLPWLHMLIQLSENIMTCRQDKGSPLHSMASPLVAAQPSHYPGSFSQTGQPASSTLPPPASVHRHPPRASEHSENGGSSPAASRHTRRSQGKVSPRQSSIDRRPASQWPRSSPAEGLGQPERSLWRSVVQHQATGSGHYRDKPQAAWGGASLLEKRSEHAPLPKLEVPESSSWLALHQVVLLLSPPHASTPSAPKAGCPQLQ